MMYRWLRNIHLFLGLFFCTFILMFGLSSVRFSHRDWFPAQTIESTTSVAAPANASWAPRTLARELMDSHGLSGAIQNIHDTDEGFGFEMFRIGTAHEIRYNRASREVQIITRTQPFMAMLNNMHTTFGMEHGYGLSDFWGFLMFLTTIGLFLLAVSGIYLWFKFYRERIIGIVLVVIGLGYGVTLIILMKTA